MLIFKNLELEDINVINNFLNYKNNRLSDFTIGGIFMWRYYFNIEYSINCDTLIFKYNGNKEISFSYPMGENIEESMFLLEEYCGSLGIDLVLNYITPDEKLLIQNDYNIIKEDTDRDWHDYIYDYNSLTSYSGRKMHGQKNHYNKFIKMYPDYKFEVINSLNMDCVFEFYHDYILKNVKDTPVAIEDAKSILEVLNNYEKYGLYGAVIKIDEKVVALSIGEIRDNVLHVHAEKADTIYLGIYQAIVLEFAKNAKNVCASNLMYINRGEDVGDIGLRTSKLSYRPIEILPKYKLTVVRKL